MSTNLFGRSLPDVTPLQSGLYNRKGCFDVCITFILNRIILFFKPKLKFLLVAELILSNSIRFDADTVKLLPIT